MKSNNDLITWERKWKAGGENRTKKKKIIDWKSSSSYLASVLFSELRFAGSQSSGFLLFKTVVFWSVGFSEVHLILPVS